MSSFEKRLDSLARSATAGMFIGASVASFAAQGLRFDMRAGVFLILGFILFIIEVVNCWKEEG